MTRKEVLKLTTEEVATLTHLGSLRSCTVQPSTPDLALSRDRPRLDAFDQRGYIQYVVKMSVRLVPKRTEMYHSDSLFDFIAMNSPPSVADVSRFDEDNTPERRTYNIETCCC